MQVDYDYLHKLLGPCKEVDDPLAWWEKDHDFSGKLWLISRIFPTLYTLRLAARVLDTDQPIHRVVFYTDGRLEAISAKGPIRMSLWMGNKQLLAEFPTTRVLDQCRRLMLNEPPPIVLPHWTNLRPVYVIKESADLLEPWLPKEELAAGLGAEHTFRYMFPEWRVSMLWDHYVKGVAM